jgi:hypothetical protein
MRTRTKTRSSGSPTWKQTSPENQNRIETLAAATADLLEQLADLADEA